MSTRGVIIFFIVIAVLIILVILAILLPILLRCRDVQDDIPILQGR
jgi:hypothetical protein